MGIMGLALALVGLCTHGVPVSRRTREIGIRMAMGALPTSVLQMIDHRQGSLPSFIGIAAGVAASAGVGGLIQGRFPGTGEMRSPI